MPQPLNPACTAAETIGLVGRLGTPQLACLRSWRRAGVRVVFLHADAAPLPKWLQRLLGVPCVHLGPLDRADSSADNSEHAGVDPAWVAKFSKALIQHGVTALTCVSEPISQVLWQLLPQLPIGVRVVSATPSQIELLSSKNAQRQAALEAGLPTLPSWLLTPSADGEGQGQVQGQGQGQGQGQTLPDEAFPLVLRPDTQRLAGADFKLAVVHTRAELERMLPALQKPGAGAWIAQPLVLGPNLLVHAWRNFQAGEEEGSERPTALAGHLGFMTEVKFQGLTVVLQPQSLPAALRQACVRLEAKLGLRGVYHYDFVQCASSGQLYFLDLNPRLGGSTGKVLVAGYDEPLALAGALSPSGLPVDRVLSDKLHRSGAKHQALQAMWSALRGRSTAADYPYPRQLQLLGVLLRFLLSGRDELVQLREWRSLLAFAAYQCLKRWSRPSGQMQAPARAATAFRAPDHELQ